MLTEPAALGYLVFAAFLQQSPDVVCGDGGGADRVVPHVVDPPSHRLHRQEDTFTFQTCSRSPPAPPPPPPPPLPPTPTPPHCRFLQAGLEYHHFSLDCKLRQKNPSLGMRTLKLPPAGGGGVGVGIHRAALCVFQTFLGTTVGQMFLSQSSSSLKELNYLLATKTSAMQQRQQKKKKILAVQND